MSKRLYAVLGTRVEESAFVSGEQDGIADRATYPWTRTWKGQGIDIEAFPAVKAWREIVEARPATQRALARANEVKS